MFKESLWLLQLIDDKAPPTARDSRGVARTLKMDVIFLTPKTVNIVGVFCSTLALSVGVSMQDEAVDVIRAAPQGAHYHADVIYLLH